MLRRSVLAAVIPLTMLVAGCATIIVGSHAARDAPFASYHTFAWAPADALPIGDPRLEGNPFFEDYLLGAVERHLRDHGIVPVARAEQPDLLLHYHATVSERLDVATMHDAMTPTGANEAPRAVKYDESTIVLDIIDARSQRLVWRGWAQDSLQNVVADQDRLRRHIEQSVVRMLERLPI